jgi:predicted RNA-binding protein YlxR (DUF448 family)
MKKDKMPDKKIPMRRCVGCMTSYPKNEVVRIVVEDGKPVIDLTGKKNGRGAYLCRSLDCFEMAKKKKRLPYALGIQITAEEISDFTEEYAKMLDDAEVN